MQFSAIFAGAFLDKAAGLLGDTIPAALHLSAEAVISGGPGPLREGGLVWVLLLSVGFGWQAHGEESVGMGGPAHGVESSWILARGGGRREDHDTASLERAGAPSEPPRQTDGCPEAPEAAVCTN